MRSSFINICSRGPKRWPKQRHSPPLYHLPSNCIVNIISLVLLLNWRWNSDLSGFSVHIWMCIAVVGSRVGRPSEDVKQRTTPKTDSVKNAHLNPRSFSLMASMKSSHALLTMDHVVGYLVGNKSRRKNALLAYRTETALSHEKGVDTLGMEDVRAWELANK